MGRSLADKLVALALLGAVTAMFDGTADAVLHERLRDVLPAIVGRV